MVPLFAWPQLGAKPVLPYLCLDCCDVFTVVMSEAYIRALSYACQALSLTYNQTAILYVIPCA